MQNDVPHLTPGDIQAYLDGELTATDSRRAHLDACPACRAAFTAQQARQQRVAARLAPLHTNLGQPPLDAPAARQRLAMRLSTHPLQEKPTMKNVFTRKTLAWGVALSLLVGSLAIPSVRSFASSLLDLFRVQQVQVVEVNPANLPQNMGDSVKLEQFMSKDVTFEQTGEVVTATTAAEAGQLAGIPVRLPQGVEPIGFQVSPGGKMSFVVNAEQMNALLAEVGYADIQIPAGLDGREVKVEMQAGVVTAFGECNEARRYQPDDPAVDEMQARMYGRDCTVLSQLPSPVISGPEGLDLSELGRAYLQLLGYSPEEAAKVAATIDWTSTLVVPLPASEATYDQVTVDGVSGTMIRPTSDYAKTTYLLLWVKDGLIYTLTGLGTNADALALANSLQ